MEFRNPQRRRSPGGVCLLAEALVKRRLPVDTEVSFLPAASYDRLFST
jgi:hypothetical protein